MPNKVKTARVILFVVGWLKIATAVVVLSIFILGSVVVGASGERQALLGSALIGSLGLFLFLIFAVLGAADLLTARGIARKQGWARTVGIILGILLLPGMPLTTVLGVFVLSGLLGREAEAWFSS